MHEHVRRLPKLKHPAGHTSGGGRTGEQKVPGGGQAAVPGVGSAWAWRDEWVTGPVWGRKESGNHDFFCLLVQYFLGLEFSVTELAKPLESHRKPTV